MLHACLLRLALADVLDQLEEVLGEVRAAHRLARDDGGHAEF
jgi:hypothetical protein